AGTLDLDDPVAEHLPAFPIRQSARDCGPLTIRALLTHSAGLPRESLGAYWSPPDFSFPPREDLLQALARPRTLYAPDTRFQYSNLGIALAGEIVATHAGVDYRTYLEERILTPLEMAETRLEFPKRPRGSVMAVGFGARDRAGNRPEMPPFDTAGIAAAAGLTSNVVDLARFAAWNFRTLDGQANAVLAPAELRDMQRVHWVDPDWNTTWGLAYEVRRAGDDTLVGHEGSCPGFNSAFALFPNHRLGVIVLTNASGIHPGVVVDNVQRLVVPTLAAAANGASVPPTPADGAAGSPLKLGPYTGRYDAQPWAGEVVVVKSGSELRVAWLPTDDVSAGLVRLRHLKDDVFFTVRDDVEIREDRWTFVRDKEGRVVALTNHALRLPRVR
ncbi:MAG: serine hydrolase, partial [Gammaproteobacteria bacterium]